MRSGIRTALVIRRKALNPAAGNAEPFLESPLGGRRNLHSKG